MEEAVQDAQSSLGFVLTISWNRWQEYSTAFVIEPEMESSVV